VGRGRSSSLSRARDSVATRWSLVRQSELREREQRWAAQPTFYPTLEAPRARATGVRGVSPGWRGKRSDRCLLPHVGAPTARTTGVRGVSPGWRGKRSDRCLLPHVGAPTARTTGVRGVSPGWRGSVSDQSLLPHVGAPGARVTGVRGVSPGWRGRHKAYRCLLPGVGTREPQATNQTQPGRRRRTRPRRAVHHGGAAGSGQHLGKRPTSGGAGQIGMGDRGWVGRVKSRGKQGYPVRFVY